MMVPDPGEKIAILGAGPAGIAAALWLNGCGVKFDWISTGGLIGGTVRRINCAIKTFVSHFNSSGQEMVEHFQHQVENAQLKVIDGYVEQLSILGPWELRLNIRSKTLVTHDYRHVLVATGTVPNLLLAQSIEKLTKDELELRKPIVKTPKIIVVVVGGGDSAFEKALELADWCEEVYIVHRRSTFRAQARFLTAAMNRGNIIIVKGDALESIKPDSNHKWKLGLTSGRSMLADAVYVRIGVRPAHPKGIEPALQENGYLNADGCCRTSIKGLYAAGDIMGDAHQSIAWACGSGSRAAESILYDAGHKPQRDNCDCPMKHMII